MSNTTVIKALGTLVQKAAGEADTKPVFRLSSQVLDRHRDRVKADSLDTSEFDLNPVLLWNHDDSCPAIGTARIYREGDEWFMEPTFDGIGELSKEVAAKVAAGTLRSCSFKFIIDEAEPNAEGGLTYLRIRVLEVSITNVPANQEALRVKNQADKPTTPEQPKGEPTQMDAFKQMLEETMKPFHERLAALEKTAAEKAEAPASEAETAPEPQAEKEPPAPDEAEASKSFLKAIRLR